MLRAAQNVEQAQRKADRVAPQADHIGRAIAGSRHFGIEALRVITDPAGAPVGYAYLGIGEPIRRAAALTAIALARSAGARNHVGADRPPFRLVAVEQGFRCAALQNQSKLPGEIVGVLDAGVHPLPARRRMDMGRLTGDEYAALPIYR